MEENMEPLCEFCGVVRAVVYCKSDSARLCLHCDSSVHSANSLSRRHARSLLCDKCNSQPAIVRCMDDKLSLCQGCDWNENGCSGSGHRRQRFNYYTGCPSMTEFSRIWSSVLDVPSFGGFDAGWDPLSTLPINENCISNCLEPGDNKGPVGLVASKLNELQACAKFEPWIGSSSVIPPNPNYLQPYNRDQAPSIPEGSNISKGYSNFKNLELHEGDDICEGLSVDDVALNFESSDEIFGPSQVTESNGHIENALEASSSGQQDCMTFQSSHAPGPATLMQAISGSPNCMLMNPCCNRNIGLGFSTGQVPSSISLSLSNITGESSAADYQDCGLSPIFLTGESPWESNLEASCPQARDKAKMRYNEKKKTRTFGKQIRYASRKARADTRKRVKDPQFSVPYVPCISSPDWKRSNLSFLISGGIVQPRLHLHPSTEYLSPNLKITSLGSPFEIELSLMKCVPASSTILYKSIPKILTGFQ
ncbi:hypothetical protein F0562_010999 [Nyssa sinensis]|uniref:CCT domain-containing protein n=1 Tax=Nyssa sinensis TaxID=561372 RepID=A0A5J5A3B7_9ASTE|nr:hypothetical protein F0562_010999 [Nyssa sinensis]